MAARDRWLDTLWPEVRRHLPDPGAVVVEIGCGSRGGFVPYLVDAGYDASGIDPEAPEASPFQRVPFEEASLPERVDATIACTSLHHVADPGAVLDAIVAKAAPDGVMIVVEWDWERFDDRTASWAFDRLGADEHDGERDDAHGWLRRQREGWVASGRTWDAYFRDWVREEGLHPASALLAELDRRFDRTVCASGPYLFGDLDDVSDVDEQLAIDEGLINALRVDYVGRARR